MNAQDALREAIGRSMRAAGQLYGAWNARFRRALRENGVRMIQPHEWVQAPTPPNGMDGWPEGTILTLESAGCLPLDAVEHIVMKGGALFVQPDETVPGCIKVQIVTQRDCELIQQHLSRLTD